MYFELHTTVETDSDATMHFVSNCGVVEASGEKEGLGRFRADM